VLHIYIYDVSHLRVKRDSVALLATADGIKRKCLSEFQTINCGAGLLSQLMECVSRRSLENTETIIMTPKVAGVQREF